MMQIYSKHIILPDREISGYLTIEDGIIQAIGDTPNGSLCYNYADDYVIPGYLDLHVHGWSTGSFWMEHTADSIREMAKNLPLTGVTSFLATSGADDVDSLKQSICAASEVYNHQTDGAQLVGIHMEGPFINPKYKGMQKEENCILPDCTLMQRLYDLQKESDMIKLMTLAVEQKGAKELMEFLHQHNIACNIGHSDATFATIQEMKPYGISGVTHMFSGMRAMHHREMGVVGYALYDKDIYCEFAKQTGMTVCHEAFDVVYRIKGSDRIYLTTDCVGYARVREPFYHYVRKETFLPTPEGLLVKKDNGESYLLNPLNDKDVAEIEMSYEKSVMEMAKYSKVTPFDVVKMTASNPARIIGLYDRLGSLEVGKDADINVVDKTYRIKQTFCKGKQVRSE